MPNLFKWLPATQLKAQLQKPSLRHRRYRKRNIAPSINTALMTAPNIAQRTKAKWTRLAKHIARTKKLPSIIVKNTAHNPKPGQPKTATPVIARITKDLPRINAVPSTAKNTAERWPAAVKPAKNATRPRINKSPLNS